MTRKNAYLRFSLSLAVALLTCAAAVNAQSSGRQERAAQPLTRRTSRTSARAGGGQSRAPVTVRARAGETLASLSARFNVAVDDLAHANNLSPDARIQTGQQIIIPPGASASSPTAKDVAAPVVQTPAVDAVDANRLRLTDGTSIEFDDAWEDARGVWYRKGGMVSLMARDRVAAIERKTQASEAGSEEKPRPVTKAKIVEVGATSGKAKEPVWIYLVGGARVEADEVAETDTGAWYKRGGLSIFLERARIERIELERPVLSEETASVNGSWIERGWTTGNPKLDELIRAGGQRYGVDPYLIFCVMEQESGFNPRALSPKGARGLMQLMPGTAARFGVRNSFDPQQNIMGGTLYLKQLLEQFSGRVDLVLASYNAGEGAVMKYGGNVPPYRETRDYVRKIGARYGQTNSLVQNTAMTSTPAQQK
jgi:soluble lytic murein transglycosylase-like protein